MPAANPDSSLWIGEWLVNPALDTISRGAETHKLEPRTMRLLVCLAQAEGHSVSLDQLLAEVWSGVVVGSASVYQTVSQLRKLLGDVDSPPRYIATVPRKGYRLVATVRPLESSADTAMRSAEPAPPVEPAPSAPSASAPPASAQAGIPKSTRAWVFWGTGIVICCAAALAFWGKKLPIGAPATAAANSIAVLPFVDMTADKSDQSLCDGLTEELSNWLSQIPTLRVVARTSAFAFQGRNEDVRQIGKALGTTHLLEGSVRHYDDHVRVTVQLIDAHDGFHEWSSSFDRTSSDTIALQDDISRAVAETLKIRLTAGAQREFAARRTADPDAYRMYLLARHLDQQATSEATDEAAELYAQVLKADPKFVPAYARLARARLNQSYYRLTPVSELTAGMEPLITTALGIDDRYADAYAVRGALRAAQGRNPEAVIDLKRAISLDPSDMGAFAELGRIQLLDGRPHEALESYEHAVSLDPLNGILHNQRCMALEDLARYDEALEACERARTLLPHSALAFDSLSWLAESRGRIDEALRWNSAAINAEPHPDFELYRTRATLYLALGLAAPARKALESGHGPTQQLDAAALVRTVFCEGGTEALRRYLSSVRLDQSTESIPLREAAYAHLLLGDAAEVKQLMARALSAPDLQAEFADEPWDSGTGNSYRVDLATAELSLGERAEAERELDIVLTMLNRMIAGGVERYATYELRAKVHALKGQSEDAMRDLSKAATLGWRRTWWARHEPYFAALESRNDYQTLLASVAASNERLIERVQSEPAL
jgi:TolB-like protein/DNA-binding winged helix-turn-helix (wHTH) protein/tetratricopeptide (TPR) repeat protein